MRLSRIRLRVELRLVERDHLAEYLGQKIPEPRVPDLVDMSTAVLLGGIMAGDFDYDEDTVRGWVELVGALR